MKTLRFGGWTVSVSTLLAVAAVAALAALFGSMKYSESPGFCNSCHIMAPYYQAWKDSKHGHVKCVECHYPPGSKKTLLWKKFQAMSQVAKYVTRTYSSRPFAEVEDASCLRSGCHSTRLLEGRVRAKTGIGFDHRPHLTEVRRGRRLRCVSCHSQVMVGSHIEVTYSSCYLCHFKGRGEGRNLKTLAGCRGCHEVPSQTVKIGDMTYNHRDFVTKQGLGCLDCHSQVVSGKGEARQERCLTCHNQPEKIARFNDIPFIHDNHVTKHNVACLHCHDEIRHGFAGDRAAVVPALGHGAAGLPAAPAPGGGAQLGQAPGMSFECSFCHENKHAGPRAMYSGAAAALGLPRMPSPMFLAQVDCGGCHYEKRGGGADAEFAGFDYRASDQACVKCHGPAYKGVWQETKDELASGLQGLRGRIKAAREALAQAQGAPAERARQAVARAERLERFVALGHGEHNIYLAAATLRRADALLTEAGEALQAKLPDISETPLLSGRFCAVLCHQRVGVKVPPESVKAFGKVMPHKAHTELMGCVSCHEIGGHKKVPLRRDVKSTCRNCHKN
ncbi:MAG: NapC/NirT family cytochrome c [Elusimicrobia bacterium]|nr:NapC/NirT family cytochrome c [Elusimicrobiota bacterium]